MIYLVIISEFLFLFLTSRRIFKTFFVLFYKITHSQKISTYLLAFLFFPGTVIHEISHMLMAGILFVPVGDIELIPRLEGNGIKMGSVRVAKTDFMRSFLIGVAPVVLGGGLLFILIFYFVRIFSFERIFIFPYVLEYLAMLYGVFVIGNTMFSSKKDMEGTVELLILVGIILAGAFFVEGKALSAFLTQFFMAPAIISSLDTAVFLLLLPLGINLVFCLLSFIKRG